MGRQLRMCASRRGLRTLSEKPAELQREPRGLTSRWYLNTYWLRMLTTDAMVMAPFPCAQVADWFTKKTPIGTALTLDANTATTSDSSGSGTAAHDSKGMLDYRKVRELQAETPE